MFYVSHPTLEETQTFHKQAAAIRFAREFVECLGQCSPHYQTVKVYDAAGNVVAEFKKS